MKKIFLFLLAIVVSCSVLADVAIRTITWTPNTEPDMSHYNLYVWEGLDTTLCPFIESDAIMPSDATFLKTISSSLSSNDWVGVADGQTYFSAVLQAVDLSGNLSNGGWAVNADNPSSHFVLTEDKDAPGEPENVQIQ